MRARYLLTCAVSALLAGAAHAATPDVATVSKPNKPTKTSASSKTKFQPAATSSSTGQDIIVTAQRRSESLQNVPLTIQAFSGKTLSQLNVKSFDDLIRFTPNVTFGNNGPGQGSIFLRGLSAGFAGNQSSATIANFPNVALYLDDQSMQFPARNVDIYVVDMNRIEVLEGPQGTLFGGGAEAGAIRYITNKPNLDSFGGHAEAGYGFTDQGGINDHGNLTVNLPVIPDKLAIRAVIYDDHRGGYIDNVPSNFTRENSDLGNYYFNIKPTAGLCPNGQPAGKAGFCALPNAPQGNNFSIARSNQNPTEYSGGRVSGLYQVTDDWSVLIAESIQNLHADGISAEYPVGSDFQTLAPLQETSFTPTYDHDSFANTAWTFTGKIAPLKVVYTGGYMVRHIDQQQDYANYSRTAAGQYYECTGGSTGFGTGAPRCYSPDGYWHDTVKNTHLTNELRLSTPDDLRIRAIGGAFFESFRIYDVMNFDYKTSPACNPANLATALAGGPACVADVRTAPGSTANEPGIRGDTTAFGEDTQRGYDQTAFFGSVDYDIIPKVLTITGGTRYYQYKEFEVGSQYGTNTSCLDVPNGQCGSGLVNIDAAKDRSIYTGFKNRASLSWHVNPVTLTYFTFSEGFRPGGFNRSVSDVAAGPDGKQYQKPNGYAPDSLTNYEVGLKTSLLDRRLQIDLSAYDMDWKNVQFLFFNPTELGNTTFGVNGPNYNIKGAEAQFFAHVTRQLTLNGSGTFNQNQQTNSPCLVGNIPGNASFGKCITQVVQTGVGLVPFQNPFGAVGSTAAFSPKFQASLRARYDWLLGRWRPYIAAGINYIDTEFNEPATYASGVNVLIPTTTLLRYKQPSYETVDASVGFTTGRWSAELFGTNLTDSHASTFTSSAQFIKSEVPIRPLVVELKVGADF